MTALILNGDPNPFLTLGCLIFAGLFLLALGHELRERVLHHRYEAEDREHERYWAHRIHSAQRQHPAGSDR